MESVHVEQDNVEDVMVNPGIGVDVLSITAVRIPEIGSFQSDTEFPEIVLEVLPLGFACRALHGAFIVLRLVLARRFAGYCRGISGGGFPDAGSGAGSVAAGRERAHGDLRV